MNKDIFICHASEDKAEVVRPLYTRLERAGFSIWYDESEINWGDSITEKVNWGLIHSRYVIVVFSRSFLGKRWPNREFNAISNSEASSGVSKILPLVVGEQYDIDQVLYAYPLINDKRFLRWKDGIDNLMVEVSKLPFEENSREGRDHENFDDLATDEYQRRSPCIHTHFYDVISPDADLTAKFIASSELDTEGAGLANSSVSTYVIDALCTAFSDYNPSKVYLEIRCRPPNEGLLSTVISAVTNDYGFANKQLVVLFDEALQASDHEAVQVLAREVVKIGASVGISRFGTGYSSLSYLKSAPFGCLFVDKSFSKDLENDANSRAILEGIFAIARSLSIDPVAYAPSVDERLEILKGMGYTSFFQ